ncbi:hypothetical protein, partial [Neglectibacter timonensis]|uniref:hypothetical protein n=1 Tax=Neglectibacter timonensis TaxID=1776382 RepID=UPI0039968642
RQKGLEPLAYCLEGSCSILLSYWRIFGAKTFGPQDSLSGKERTDTGLHTSMRPDCTALTRPFTAEIFGAGDGNRSCAPHMMPRPPKALLLVSGSPLRPKNIPPGCFLYGQTLSGSIPLSAVRNFWSG